MAEGGNRRFSNQYKPFTSARDDGDGVHVEVLVATAKRIAKDSNSMDCTG